MLLIRVEHSQSEFSKRYLDKHCLTSQSPSSRRIVLHQQSGWMNQLRHCQHPTCFHAIDELQCHQKCPPWKHISSRKCKHERSKFNHVFLFFSSTSRFRITSLNGKCIKHVKPLVDVAARVSYHSAVMSLRIVLLWFIWIPILFFRLQIGNFHLYSTYLTEIFFKHLNGLKIYPPWYWFLNHTHHSCVFFTFLFVSPLNLDFCWCCDMQIWLLSDVLFSLPFFCFSSSAGC